MLATLSNWCTRRRSATCCLNGVIPHWTKYKLQSAGRNISTKKNKRLFIFLSLFQPTTCTTVWPHIKYWCSFHMLVESLWRSRPAMWWIVGLRVCSVLRKASVMEEHGCVLFIQNFLATTDCEANRMQAEGCATVGKAWKRTGRGGQTWWNLKGYLKIERS